MADLREGPNPPLADQAVAIAISPMVVLASDKKLLQARQGLSRRIRRAFSGAVCDRYEAVALQSATGARHLAAQMLVLDTILFETPNSVYALLSPLHPLHLWKYVRLAEQLRDEKETLTDEQKSSAGRKCRETAAFRNRLVCARRACRTIMPSFCQKAIRSRRFRAISKKTRTTPARKGRIAWHASCESSWCSTRMQSEVSGFVWLIHPTCPNSWNSWLPRSQTRNCPLMGCT